MNLENNTSTNFRKLAHFLMKCIAYIFHMEIKLKWLHCQLTVATVINNKPTFTVKQHEI